MTERLRRSKSEREIVDFVRKEGLGFGVGHQWEYDWDISVIFPLFFFIYQHYGCSLLLSSYISIYILKKKKTPFEVAE